MAKQLKPNEVIVTWVYEDLSCGKYPVNRRVYLADAEKGTHSEYLSSAKRYTPSEAIEAIRILRAHYPHMQTMFVQTLGFLPENEGEVPRPLYAAWKG